MPHRLFSPAVAVLAVILLTATSGWAAQSTSVALGDDPRIEEAGLVISEFVTGLYFPYGIVGLLDGSLLVATNDPGDETFFQSTGSLLRLADEDGDGVADDEATILVTDLPGPLTAVNLIDDLVFVTSARVAEERIGIYRAGEDWSQPLTHLGDITFNFAGGEHQTYTTALRPTEGRDDTYDLIFNLGGASNQRPGGQRIEIGGLVEYPPLLRDSSIYMVRVTDDGTDVSVSEPVLVATGLRNAATIVLDPETGDLMIADMGIDLPRDRWDSLSPDEINVIPADEIGVEVYDFGFPSTYIDYTTGEQVGDTGTPPLWYFTPLDGSQSEGLASLTQMPAGFPELLRDGYAAGFHGQTMESGNANEENPLIWIDMETGDRFELISNDNPGIGHVNSLWASENALYVVDLCSTGFLDTREPCGVIYRITSNG